MPEGLDHDELIERWTMVDEELERSRVKRGVNGLAFALLWKFFLHHARFPRGPAVRTSSSARTPGRGCGAPRGHAVDDLGLVEQQQGLRGQVAPQPPFGLVQGLDHDLPGHHDVVELGGVDAVV